MIRKGETSIPGYRLEKFLGKGQFGEVWRASAPGGTSAALKFINLGQTQSLKELRAVRRVKEIRHPNLMPITAMWTLDAEGNLLSDRCLENFGERALPASEHATLAVADGWLSEAEPKWLVVAMLLGNQSLQQRLEECTASGLSGIPVQELLGYMEEAAKGIDYLNTPQHDLGEGPVAIQHCDIKPANMMLIGDAAVICDFGLARVLSSTGGTATSMIGSPAYMPPECITSRPGPGSDQYALAISYVELRTGELPFAALNYVDVLDAKQKGMLDLSRLPVAEQSVLLRATAIDPAQRFPSARAFVGELRRAAATEVREKPGRRPLFRWPLLSPAELTPSDGPAENEQERLLAAQREELARSNEQLRRERDELTTAHQKLEEQQKEQAVAAERIRQQRMQLASRERKLQEIEQQLAAEREENSKRRELLLRDRELLATLRQRLARKNNEQQLASGQLRQQRTQLEQLEQRIQEQEQRLAAERSAMVHRHEELLQEREALSASRDRFDRQTLEQRSAAEKLQEQWAALENESRSVRDREQELAAEREEIARCQEQLGRDREALVASRARFEAARRQHPSVAERSKSDAPSRDATSVSVPPVPSSLPASPPRGRRELFVTQSQLGRGPVGVVYKAQRKEDGGWVALKVVETLETAAGAEHEARLRELDFLRRLQHPNIARVLDVGWSDREYFLATEFCEGGNLQGLVKRFGGRIPLDKLSPLMIYSLFGLQYLHDSQQVHGNIKLENVLLAGDEDHWIPKIGDFGAIGQLAGASHSSFALSGDMVGISAFLPRSQIPGDPRVNMANDVWSLAATFYYALTGYFPVDIADGRDTLAVMLQNQPVPIRSRNPSLTSEVASVMDRALSVEPDKRFWTAAEMRGALWQALLARGALRTGRSVPSGGAPTVP